MKVTIFAWLVAVRKILTMDNPKKRHVSVVDYCCMCKRGGKFVYCLLLYRGIAMVLRNSFFSRVGLAWVMPKRVVNLFTCLQW
jgi:hypothetical protein